VLDQPAPRLGAGERDALPLHQAWPASAAAGTGSFAFRICQSR
jgi:hypothetical protein